MRIVFEYSGQCEIEETKTIFVNMDSGKVIDGGQYREMSEGQRKKFVLASLCDTIRDAVRSSWSSVDHYFREADGEEAE